METVYIVVRGPSKYPVYEYGFFTSYEEAKSISEKCIYDSVYTLNLHNGKAMSRKVEIQNQIAELQKELNSL